MIGAWRSLAVLAVLACAALAGCATVPATAPDIVFPPAVDTPFEISGRLSARHAGEAVAVSFRWRHQPDGDELLMASPLGQTLARLVGSPAGVRIELAEGRALEGSDWEALTRDTLGAPIPLRGLAWWVRGVPHPGTAYGIERDGAARVAVLRQDGWEIVYDYDGVAPWPRRLRLSYPDVEIRLAVDAWQ